MAWYWDSSALVKLVVAEAQTDALLTWRSGLVDQSIVSCDLVRTEVPRAVRVRNPDAVAVAHEMLHGIYLLKVGSDVFDVAGRLAPASLRSLDAIHVAAALMLGDELDGIVCYDDRLASAARHNGVVVVAPS